MDTRPLIRFHQPFHPVAVRLDTRQSALRAGDFPEMEQR
jgi:hypothetical protein